MALISTFLPAAKTIRLNETIFKKNVLLLLFGPVWDYGFLSNAAPHNPGPISCGFALSSFIPSAF